MVFFSAVYRQERVPGEVCVWGGGAVFIYMWMHVELKIKLGGQSSGAVHFQKKNITFLYPSPTVSVYLPQSVRVRKSEDNLWELVLSFHRVDPRD